MNNNKSQENIENYLSKDKNKYLNSKIKILNNSCDYIKFEPKNNNFNKLYKYPKINIINNKPIKSKEILNKNYLDNPVKKKNNNQENYISKIKHKFKLKQNKNEYLIKYSIKGHKSEITCMTLLKAQNEIATGSFDKLIKIWRISKFDSEILFISELAGHEDSVLSLKYIHKDNRLLSTSRDKTIKIWDITYLNCIQTLKYHNSSMGKIF